MLDFDEKTGFSVSEVEDLRTEVAQSWVDAMKENGRPDLDTSPETPQGQIIDSQVASIHQKDTELAFLAQQFNPKTSSGVWQDALAKIYFITRKPAISSSAVCTLTGIYNTLIPVGSQIKSTYDQTIWTLTEDVTIGENGTAEGTFTCDTAGPVQAGANTLTQIVTTVPNWSTVTNTSAATVGSYEESQAAFEARRYQSVALNSRGTDASVFARVAQVDGVIATYVTSNRTNVNKAIDGYTLKPHSIYVAVIGGSDADIAGGFNGIHVCPQEQELPAVLVLLSFDHLLNLGIGIPAAGVLHAVCGDDKQRLLRLVLITSVLVNVADMVNSTTYSIQQCRATTDKVGILRQLCYLFHRYPVMDNIAGIIKQHCGNNSLP